MRRAALALVACVVAACGQPRTEPPAAGLEAWCADTCVASAHACDAPKCAHGCRLLLDKLVEREGGRVLACVAKASACDDATFAECAVRSGPYVDGGPAVVKRAPDEDDE
jgi:hypothetical protein